MKQNGKITLQLGILNSSLKQENNQNEKQISIENTGECDCFVRVKIFAPSYILYAIDDNAGKWNKKSDGYWYYTKPLYENNITEKLTITANSETNINKIVVISETTEATYDENGVVYGNWEKVHNT